MFFQDLPVELLDGICQNATRADLVALAQTSTLLSPVAQRVLYRQVSISPLSHNLSVVVTLALRPDVACFVRSFSLNVDVDTPVFHSFHVLLATALSHMSELTSLDLCISPSASWVLTPAANCMYPRLRRLACSFPFDHHVVQFLNKTPALLQLELESTTVSHPSALPSLPLTSVPCLDQFIGSCDVAKVIIPGRPLESIHLTSGDLTEEDVRCLADGTARVRIFGATTRSLPSPLLDLLDLLARHLPHIVYLRIMTTHNFPAAPDVVFYEEVANGLAALPDLSAFELSGMHWGSCKKGKSGDRRVWQSQPLTSDLPLDTDVLLPY